MPKAPITKNGTKDKEIMVNTMGIYNREGHYVWDGNYNRDNNFNQGDYGNRNDRTGTYVPSQNWEVSP